MGCSPRQISPVQDWRRVGQCGEGINRVGLTRTGCWWIRKGGLVDQWHWHMLFLIPLPGLIHQNRSTEVYASDIPSTDLNNVPVRRDKIPSFLPSLPLQELKLSPWDATMVCGNSVKIGLLVKEQIFTGTCCCWHAFDQDTVVLDAIILSLVSLWFAETNYWVLFLCHILG